MVSYGGAAWQATVSWIILNFSFASRILRIQDFAGRIVKIRNFAQDFAGRILNKILVCRQNLESASGICGVDVTRILYSKLEQLVRRTTEPQKVLSFLWWIVSSSEVESHPDEIMYSKESDSFTVAQFLVTVTVFAVVFFFRLSSLSLPHFALERHIEMG